MSTSDLRSLLDGVPDTREIVLRRDPTWSPGCEAWRDAAEDAAAALAAWRRAPTRRLRGLPRRAGPRGRGAGRARLADAGCRRRCGWRLAVVPSRSSARKLALERSGRTRREPPTDPRAATPAYVTLVGRPRWGPSNRPGHLLCDGTRSSLFGPEHRSGLPLSRRAGPAQRSLLAHGRTTVPLVRPHHPDRPRLRLTPPLSSHAKGALVEAPLGRLRRRASSGPWLVGVNRVMGSRGIGRMPDVGASAPA